MDTDQPYEEDVSKIQPENKSHRVQTAEGWKRSMLKKKLAEKGAAEKNKKKKDAA